MKINKQKKFIIVELDALPEVFIKVVEVKTLLESGKSRSIQEAVKEAGISRSSFYKYKDSVFPFYENTRGRTITFAMNLEHVKGILSNVLNAMAEVGANILTINQTIPINNIANVTITCETGDKDMFQVFDRINLLEGVKSLKILARE